METRWPGGQCSGAREGAMSVRVLPGEPAQAGFLGTEVSRSQCFQGHDSSWEESSEAGGEGRTRQGSGPAAASAGLPSDRRLRTLGGRGGRQLVPNAPPDAGGGGGCGARRPGARFLELPGQSPTDWAAQTAGTRLPAPEASSPSWRCGQGGVRSEAAEEEPALPLPASGGPGHLLLGSGPCLSDLCLRCHRASFPSSFCVLPRLRRTPVMGFSARPKPRMTSAQGP